MTQRQVLGKDCAHCCVSPLDTLKVKEKKKKKKGQVSMGMRFLGSLPSNPERTYGLRLLC